MDIPAIASFLNSLKATADVAKGLIALNAETAVKEKVIELGGIIIDLQQQASTILMEQHKLIDENNTLLQKIKQMENWKKTKTQYELAEVSAGIFVQLHDKAEHGGEPSHWACERCFQDQKRSVLQLQFETAGSRTFMCHRCKNSIEVSFNNPYSRLSRNEPPDSDGWEAGMG
jgi:hypothetical protein